MRLTLVGILLAVSLTTAALSAPPVGSIRTLIQTVDTSPPPYVTLARRPAFPPAHVEARRIGAAVFTTRQELDDFIASLTDSSLKKELVRKRTTLMSLSFVKTRVVLAWLNDGRWPLELVSVTSEGRRASLLIREISIRPSCYLNSDGVLHCPTTASTVSLQTGSSVVAVVDANIFPRSPILSVSLAPRGKGMYKQ